MPPCTPSPVVGARRFFDRVRVLAMGGKGGDGCISFFRDNRTERGPPDGGSGGAGGSVILRSSHNVSDLHMSKRNLSAESGGSGHGDGMTGRSGKDFVVDVPCGTVISRAGMIRYNRHSRMEPREAEITFVTELLKDGDTAVVAEGGTGGRGNAAFRGGRLQHQRMAENGLEGQSVTLQLSLKLIADVGLVGFPNAGKSSLLAALSNARPKVANYEFTTLHPHLGSVTASPIRSFTMADIPGLISGAHANRGLGHHFLRHIERTSLLCYVIDLGSAHPPLEQLLALRTELDLYQPGLSQRPCVIVANKGDADGAAQRLRELRAAVYELKTQHGHFSTIVPPLPGGSLVTAVSALRRHNLERLVQRLDQAVAAAIPQEEAAGHVLRAEQMEPRTRVGVASAA